MNRRAWSSLLLILAISSFIRSHCYSQNILLSSSCPNDTTENSTLISNSNVNIILGSLSSKAASNFSFYYETSNRIYGLYLCRGDVSAEDCRGCVSNASQEIKKTCSSSTTKAIIWYDYCMLRYSYVNFFGNVEMSPRIVYWSRNTSLGSLDTNDRALGLFQRLIERLSETDTMYVNMEENSDLDVSRYGSVQCTRDIDKLQCQNCLKNLMNYTSKCCMNMIGWRILTPNCNLRYDGYPFYDIPAPAPPPHPLSPPPQPPPSNEVRKGNKTGITVITISTVAAIAILLGLLLLYYAFFCRMKSRERDRSEEFPMHYFSLSTLKAATDNFSDANRLGEGGFGPVYKGKLIGGEEIAVKRMSAKSSQGHEEFKNEAKVILKLQHKNLVRLFGCCLDGDEKLLVYEYMANTSLDAFLFDPLKCKQLDWLKRENIVNGIARGILYLHEDSRLKIIHRDLKASNILLDDEMNAKISDFGTARIFGGKQIDASTNRIVGTYGYMAPEYAMEGLFSVKSDVYSFGVLMLEVISGRKCIGFLNVDRADNLLSYAWELWNEGRALEMIDKNLGGDCPMKEALKWIHIALLCVQEDANIRPTMSMVVLMLGSQSIALPKPSRPPFL